MLTQPFIPIQYIRWFETEQAETLYKTRREQGGNLHLSPGSTLVAAMGSHWKPGCFEAVRNMAEHTYKGGYQVCLYEEHDRCLKPYDALGIMRNLAYKKALLEGWEYLLYVDNDVQPPRDALTRLLQRPVPIISPIIEFWDGQVHGINMPKMVHNVGLVMVTSVVLSFLLIRTSVFLPWALTPFWQDAIGADEDYHFRKFEMSGHRPFVDTDVVVQCVEPPHFPLDHKE